MADNKKTVNIEFKATGYGDLSRQLKGLAKSSEDLIKSNDKLNKINKKIPISLNKMTMDLKELGTSFKKTGININVLKRAYDGHKTSIEKVRRATKAHIRTLKGLDAQNKRVSKGTRILGGTLAVVRSKLLLFNFALGFAIRQVARFAVQSAKVESMGKAFNTLSGGVDSSEIAFQKLQQATDSTMSEFDLFQQANNAMILGVSKNSDEMAEMFDIAQRLGRALGRDTASSVESLVTGIGRQSRLMLDNIGIIVKADEAYGAYARKLGTTSDRLTDAQKKQAFLEATMKSARAKVNSLGAETKSTQDAFDKLSASTENLVTFLGDKLSPITTSLANDLSNMADAISGKGESKELSRQEKLNEILKERNLLLDGNSFKEMFPEEVTAIDDNFFETIISGQLGLRESTIEQINSIDSTISKYNDLIFVEQQRLEIQKSTNTLTTENLIKQQEVIPEISSGVSLLNNNYSFLDKNQLSILKGAEMLSGAFAQATIHGQNFGDAVTSSLKSIASQIVSKGAMFGLLNMFGVAPAGGLAKFLFAHTGGYIKEDKTIQRFATGGQVQGEDNVPIMAQAGEFVMSRNAVDSIGIDNLAKMNQTGNSGVTINVQGNLIGEDSYVRDNLIPAIQKAQGLNLA